MRSPYLLMGVVSHLPMRKLGGFVLTFLTIAQLLGTTYYTMKTPVLMQNQNFVNLLCASAVICAFGAVLLLTGPFLSHDEERSQLWYVYIDTAR